MTDAKDSIEYIKFPEKPTPVSVDSTLLKMSFDEYHGISSREKEYRLYEIQFQILQELKRLH